MIHIFTIEIAKQIVDILTKPLPQNDFQNHQKKPMKC